MLLLLWLASEIFQQGKLLLNLLPDTLRKAAFVAEPGSVRSKWTRNKLGQQALMSKFLLNLCSWESRVIQKTAVCIEVRGGEQ